MEYRFRVTIALKEGMLDPEARAIKHALHNLGFELKELKSARVFILTLEADSEADARRSVERMCERLLANPVIHRYTIEALA